MTRDTFTQIAQAMCARNGVATLVTPDIRAVLYVNPDHLLGTSLDYLALVPDGRFRFGSLTIQAFGTPTPLSHAHPGPSGPEALAAWLRRAIDHRDAMGTVRDCDRTFTLYGWSPWKRQEASGNDFFFGRAEDMAMPWLPRVAPGELGCLNAAWDAVLAGHVTPEHVEAAEAFSAIQAFDPAAFDEAAALTLGGARCRAFARDNVLVAFPVLSHPSTRSLVANGASLREVIDALPADEPILKPAYGSRKARVNAIARLSGVRTDELGSQPMIELALAALESLPPEWSPRTDADLNAFARLCRGAVRSYALSLPADAAPDWWRKAFAGAGAGWSAFAARVVDAGMEPPWRLNVALVLNIAAERRAHIVGDLFLPLAQAFETPNLRTLADRSGTWMGPLKPTAPSALHDFAHHALTDGMDLPAVASQGKRHLAAHDAIRDVIKRFPRNEPASTVVELRTRSLSDEIPRRFLGTDRGYDAQAPGALDAMLAAWQPVLPRRLRPLQARELAASLDAEAARYLAARG